MSKHDLLIIGAGLAGLRAAVEGVRQGLNVAVITKVHPVRSHSNAAQGGINAALTDRGDDWRDHALATIKGSDYLADQDAVEVMCREAGEAIIELENMGVIFSRDEEGKLGTRAFGGQKKARTYFGSHSWIELLVPISVLMIWIGFLLLNNFKIKSMAIIYERFQRKKNIYLKVNVLFFLIVLGMAFFLAKFMVYTSILNMLPTLGILFSIFVVSQIRMPSFNR